MPENRKTKFARETNAGGEMTLQQVAKYLGTTQTALRELYQAGELRTLLRPQGRELVSDQTTLVAWCNPLPQRAPTIRRGRRQPPPDVWAQHSGPRRWWLECLWYRSLTGGRAWEASLPESELAKAYVHGGGYKTEDLFEFLLQVCPEEAPPIRIRHRTHWIDSGKVMRGDRVWIKMPDAELCRANWNKLFGAMHWDLAVQETGPFKSSETEGPGMQWGQERPRDAFGQLIDEELEKRWRETPWEEREDQEFDKLLAAVEAEPDIEEQHGLLRRARAKLQNRRDKAGSDLAQLEAFRMKLLELEGRISERLPPPATA